MATKTPQKETVVERYLVARVQALGGVAEKTASPSARGYYDRVCVLPGGRVMFVEVKRPRGGKVSPHQAARHQAYLALGAELVVIKSCNEVDRLLEGLMTGA